MKVPSLQNLETPEAVETRVERPRIPCNSCAKGSLIPLKVYRHSKTAVMTGYILLVPSIFALGVGVGGYVMTLLAGTYNLPDPAITVATLAWVLWSVASFAAGICGWLLIMKKRVLKCTNCDVTIAAG